MDGGGDAGDCVLVAFAIVLCEGDYLFEFDVPEAYSSVFMAGYEKAGAVEESKCSDLP